MTGIFMQTGQSRGKFRREVVTGTAKSPLEVFSLLKENAMRQMLSISEEINLEKTYDDRIDQFEGLSSQRLQNPYTTFIPEAHPDGKFEFSGKTLVDVQVGWFEGQVEQFRESLPEDKRNVIPNFKQVQAGIPLAAQERQLKADEAFEHTTLTGKAAGIAGELTAFMHDPLILATLPANWPSLAGRSTLQAMARVGLSEALLAGGSEALIQPIVQEFRGRLGFKDAGFEAGLRNVILATGAGGFLGGTLAGLSKQGEKLLKRIKAIQSQNSRTLAQEILDNPNATLEERALAGQLEKDANQTDDNPLWQGPEQPEPLADIDKPREGITEQDITPAEQRAAARARIDQSVADFEEAKRIFSDEKKANDEILDSGADIPEERIKIEDQARDKRDRAKAKLDESAAESRKVEEELAKEKVILEVEAQRAAEKGEAGETAERTKRKPDEAQPDANLARLPPDLQRSSPKYNFGSRPIDLTFENDIAKALFVVGGKGKSKAHDRFLKFLKDAGVENIDREAKKIRASIKAQAKSGSDSATVGFKRSEPDPAQQAAAQKEHDARTIAADEAAEKGELPDIPDEPNVPASGDVISTRADNSGSTAELIDPRGLNVDADRFQFKSATDEAGVSARLADVKEWDQTKAGLTLVWEDSAGNRFIADGHQRTGLAKKILESNPDADVRLLAIVRKEQDGFSAEDVMVEAAMKNIAETDAVTPQLAIDAAKVMRIRPEEMEGLLKSLPPRSTMVRTISGLINLSDKSFSHVINQKISATHGAMVARLVQDPSLQDAIMDVLIREQVIRKTDIEAEAIIRQAREVGTRTEVQESLFGEEVLQTSLFSERAKVLQKTLQKLRKEKSVFKNLVANKGKIEQEGNALKTDTNQQIAQESAVAVELLMKLANRTGALSDALTNAARLAGETKKFGPAVDQFVDSVREAITRGDFEGLAVGGAGRSDEVSPQARANPEQSTAVRDVEEVEGFDEVKPGAVGPEIQSRIFDEELETIATDPALAEKKIPVEVVDPNTGKTNTTSIKAGEIAEEAKGDDDFLNGLAGCIRGGSA